MKLETLLPELNEPQRALLLRELVKVVGEPNKVGDSTEDSRVPMHLSEAVYRNALRAEVIGRLEAFCLGESDGKGK